LNTGKVRVLFSLENPVKHPTILPSTYQWHDPNDKSGFIYQRTSDSYHWFCFPHLADFQISPKADKIFCYSAPNTSEETVRHLLLDQVLPRCLAQQGRVMLHASGVRIENGAILFLGDSGSGKSTLATFFHLAGQPVVSDDCIWIKELQNPINAIPTYRGLRMWEDSLDVFFPVSQSVSNMANYSSKKRVSVMDQNSSVINNGLPIVALFVLCPVEQSKKSAINIDRLNKRDAFIALVKQCFQLDIMDIKRINRFMRAMGGIVLKLPSYRLAMPHDYDLLPLARQKILETALNHSAK
jgi:energy-coupling factor transporter ATP-binding protein EcfA2